LLCYGCNFYGNKERTWTEDVTLQDGRRVVIKRHVEFGDSNSLSQDSYSATETNSTIEFTGEQASLPVWSAPLIALVLYQDPKTQGWVVVAKTSSCDLWYARGHPKPPYWEYRIVEGKWQETPLSADSIGRSANLFYNYHAGLPAKHMTMELKGSDAQIASTYRTVQTAEATEKYCKT
jgi:hypothetical protein